MFLIFQNQSSNQIYLFMNHKDRVRKTLQREAVDRVPFFYWGVPEFSEKMMKHLGLQSRDELLEHLDVDFRWIEPAYIGPNLMGADGKTKKDIWGVGYHLVQTNGLQYWDVNHFPLKGVTEPNALEQYPWPQLEWFDFQSLNEQIERYAGYAIMTAPGYSSPGLFRIAQRLIGKEDFESVMMLHPKFFRALCDRIVEFYVRFVDAFFEVAENRVDFIRIADDFGALDGLTISPEIWENYCKPAIEAFVVTPRKLGVKFYMHSCGGVRKLLPELISVGADVLDPIQTRALGMEPTGLKKDFGSLISFCGALDEELLLRDGTPEQVREGVDLLLQQMTPGGGFILGPSHKLKVETPVENVLAMYEAAKAWKMK